MLHKMRKAKNLWCRRYDAEKEMMWVPGVGKDKNADLGLCQCSYLTNPGLHIVVCAECQCWLAGHCAADVVYLVYLPNFVRIPPHREQSLISNAKFYYAEFLEWLARLVPFSPILFINFGITLFFHATRIPHMFHISSVFQIHRSYMIQCLSFHPWSRYTAQVRICPIAYFTVLWALDTSILRRAFTIHSVRFRVNSRQTISSCLS